MIRVALWLISATSLVALTHTTGWAGLFLALLAFTPLIALILTWREPPLSPHPDLSRLDRLDGVGNPNRTEPQ